MTFIEKETSESEGNPIELFTFTSGNATFRYTNASNAVQVLGATYNPIPIGRTSVEQKQDMGRLPVEVTTIPNLDIIIQWIESPSTTTVGLTIQQLHGTDGVTPEVFVIWQGRVLDVEFMENSAKVRCEPIYTSLKRPGLRRKYQRQCPHVLYGSSCKADRDFHKVTAEVASVDGVTLTYTNDSNDGGGNPMPSGELVGGFIEWVANSVTQSRAIKTHVDKTITITLPSGTLTPGTAITLYRGCAHNTNDCALKFANLDNYGGFPYSPNGRNPFATHSPLF